MKIYYDMYGCMYVYIYLYVHKLLRQKKKKKMKGRELNRIMRNLYDDEVLFYTFTIL